MSSLRAREQSVEDRAVARVLPELDGPGSRTASAARPTISAAIQALLARRVLDAYVHRPGRDEPFLAEDGGLFVPKPSRDADGQVRSIPDLGSIVCGCPLVSAADGSDSYSLGYSPLASAHGLAERTRLRRRLAVRPVSGPDKR